jgi:hypothetical protein
VSFKIFWQKKYNISRWWTWVCLVMMHNVGWFNTSYHIHSKIICEYHQLLWLFNFVIRDDVLNSLMLKLFYCYCKSIIFIACHMLAACLAFVVRDEWHLLCVVGMLQQWQQLFAKLWKTLFSKTSYGTLQSSAQQWYSCMYCGTIKSYSTDVSYGVCITFH